ncbi:AcrB/AcrD/AcrF family protein [Salipiger thiooxidans]|uniref:AcrB/AcrD/AcrF family protein n=1 Tax=Salipiger thiooxidans TaxID=282683 RepID=A0A1G7JWF3_9RHOB|nr:AcrB/AcrD/AcrF family protein [Salipiger thiooxidans]
MVTAMTLSLVFAIVLSPPMSARLLRPRPGHIRFAPARWFNSGMDRFTHGYGAGVRGTMRAPLLVLATLFVVLGGAWWVYQRIDSSFIPTEDQGVVMTQVSLSEGATTQQTLATVKEVEDYLLNEEGAAVESTFASLGFGFGGSGQNSAMIFVKLRDFEERQDDPSLSAASMAGRVNLRFATHRAGRVMFMQPPAIPGRGNTGGFTMYLVDQAGNGSATLKTAAEQLVAAARQNPGVSNVDARGTDEDSALRIDIDNEEAEIFGVSLSAVNSMLSVIFAGSEVNDFVLGSLLRPVIVQAAPEHRMQPEDIVKWNAINADDEVVPFASFMTTSWEPVAPTLQRRGGTSALEISGSAGEGVSSGAAMDAMEETVADLDGGYGSAWTGISYQERRSGDQAPWLGSLGAGDFPSTRGALRKLADPVPGDAGGARGGAWGARRSVAFRSIK